MQTEVEPPYSLFLSDYRYQLTCVFYSVDFLFSYQLLSVKFQRTTDNWDSFFRWVMDTHRKNADSRKTQALTKSINMDFWVVSSINQDKLGLSIPFVLTLAFDRADLFKNVLFSMVVPPTKERYYNF